MAVGIVLIIAFDFLFKLIKARIISNSNDLIDEKLQKKLFQKVLSWDLDSRPKYSGASSTLIRDLENVIELFANSTITTLVALPFIFINILVIALIAGPVAFVVSITAIICLGYSVYFYKVTSQLGNDTKNASIEKNSLFLEAVSNLETLKSIGNYDYFLSKWDVSDKSARQNSLKLKNLLADANSTNALFQALSQVAVVSVGAYYVINGGVTSGALIAAVILNGKTIQPIIQLSSLLQNSVLQKLVTQN